jgi:hypothetical protein
MAASSFRQWLSAECPQGKVGDMTEFFYWKELERRARAAQALAMLSNRMDTSGINEANAILDELCLDRRGAERLIRSRMPPRPIVLKERATLAAPNAFGRLRNRGHK